MKQHWLSRRIIVFALLLCILASFACANSYTVTGNKIYAALYDAYGRVLRTVTYDKIILPNETVAGKWVSGDYTFNERNQIRNRFINDYGLTPERDATPKYNCHSYAWYSTGANNLIWFDDPSKYLKPNNLVHTQTSGFNSLPSAAKVNYKVVYYEGSSKTHSALVDSLSGSKMLISKWGQAGLYKHSIKKCPYYLENSSFKLEYYKG